MIYKTSSRFRLGRYEVLFRDLLDSNVKRIGGLAVSSAFEYYPISRPTKERAHHGT